MPSRRWLAVEFFLLFVAVPSFLALRLVPALPIPILLVAAIVIYRYLRRQSLPAASDAAVRRLLRPMLIRDALIMLAIGIGVAVFRPNLLFNFPRRATAFWAVVMVLYPLLSVYPQELIYRAFLFHRYRPLFTTQTAMILASGAAFGYVHIIFGNWLAIVFTLAGGVMFASTYGASRSLKLVSLEHALFGDFLFTIGLGQFFYHGRFG